MKQVIFVGGTAYSGSTFFDMTLANDPGGFSAGEVYALFNPYRAHHINPLCGCGDPACEIWPKVLANGPEKLYQTIFELLPNVDFIVDSSKDPFWISRQLDLLQETSFEAKNIVIWKTPLELAHSFKKREQLERWERNWANYFRMYYTRVDNWRSIPYADYAQVPSVLETICRYLDIPYFVGKEEFWRKKHHLLFGNESARVHLNSADNHVDKIEQNDPAGKPREIRTVYYKAVDDPELETLVARRMAESPYLQSIVNLLTARDVRNDADQVNEAPDLKMSASEVQVRRLRQSVTRSIGRVRYVRKHNRAA